MVIVSATASIAFAAPAEPSAPVGLLVNGVSNPLAIDRDTTRFTWTSKDLERGETQTAYQILIASSAKCLEAGKANWWDCGQITLTELGKRLWPATSAAKDPGVLAVSEEDSSIKCLVASGPYRFNETW